MERGRASGPVARHGLRRGCCALALVALALSWTPGGASAQPSSDQELFEVFDRNGDGKIDNTEFRIYKMLVFRLNDLNNDSMLSYEETQIAPEEFKAADLDGDGQLDGFEWIDAPFTRSERVDRNSDGYITFDEFQLFLESIRRKPGQ